MPELPEVETMAAGLREVLLGRVLEHVKIFERGVLRNTPPRAVRGLEGCRLIGLNRRGKFIQFHLSNGTMLLFHLKMTGRLVVVDRDYSLERWERLHMKFVGWDRRISFQDQRKFGYLAVMSEGAECPVPLVYELGPDALKVSRSELREIFKSSSRPVKALLLDQRVIAGLGNIYVDESLHRARIHPLCQASQIPTERVDSLHRAMGHILRRAIECGGSSVRSYLDSRGKAGTFQKYHRVYGRKGERCRRCRSEISYGKMASRGTHFCPDCQSMFPPPKARKRKGKKH